MSNSSFSLYKGQYLLKWGLTSIILSCSKGELLWRIVPDTDYRRRITKMSANDYIINVSAHIQSRFEANFGLKNAKVLLVLMEKELASRSKIHSEIFYSKKWQFKKI